MAGLDSSNARLRELKRRSAFFLDKDGTISIGTNAIPGAKEFIAKLRRKGADYYVLTNNSSKTPQQHLKGLRQSGFDFTPKNMLLSTDVAARFLVENKLRRVFWVASESVGKYLAKTHGLKFEARKPDALLLTYDDTIDYAKLTAATKLLRAGVRYFATHPDIVCPSPDGPLPDIGTYIETLRMTTGRSPENVFGKPALAMVESTLKQTGKKLSDAVIIGDRLYTDLKMAAGTKMLSVLVLTGETTRAQYEAQEIRADIVIDNLAVLAEYL